MQTTNLLNDEHIYVQQFTTMIVFNIQYLIFIIQYPFFYAFHSIFFGTNNFSFYNNKHNYYNLVLLIINSNNNQSSISMGKKNKNKSRSAQQKIISQLFQKHQDTKKIKKYQKPETDKKQEKNKQKIVEKPQSNESQIDQNQDNGDIDLNNVQNQSQINVSFLIAQINDEYYHSLKTILRRYGQIVKINQSEIAACVVDNKNCGNVALADDDNQESQNQKQSKSQGEDDQLNAYSILNIFSGKLQLCKKIKGLAAKSIQKKGKQFSQIRQILQAESCSVLINERLPNLPAFVVQNSHQVFKKQLQDLKKTDIERLKSFCGEWLVNVSQIQREGSDQLEKLIFSKFEDFQMCKNAKKWWLGQNLPTHRKKADLRRLYYVIKTEDYLKGVQKIGSYLE